MAVDYNSFLQAVDEFIFNEDKIVTYKWISNELKIHVNTAKQLLYAFANKEDMNGKLLVTYIVSGINEDGISHSVTLVTEKNLSKVKSSLKTVTSEHVYSVQKAALSASLNDFYNLESETCAKIDRKNGTIHIDTDILREEVQQLTIHPAEDKKPTVGLKQQKQQDKNNVSGKQKILSPVKKNEPTINIKSEKENKPATETHNGTNTISPSKNNKSKTSPKKLDKKGSKKSVPVKNGGIGAFFSKQATLAAEKQASKKEEVKTQKEDQGEEIENIPDNTLDIDNKKKSSIESSSTKESNSCEKKSSKKTEKSVMKKRKNSSESIGKNRKKMKRIMIASDSESSGDEVEMEVEEEPPPPMSPEPVAKAESDDEIIPPTPVEKGKRRVRKQVDRIFTDEDDFLLTKKEFVYKSSSEDETEPKEKVQKNVEQPPKSPKKTPAGSKRVVKKSPKKKTSPLINKQSSIKNFFPKK